jgi:hypothetical protein
VALGLVVFIFQVHESLLVLSHMEPGVKRLALEFKKAMFRGKNKQELIDGIIASDLKQLMRQSVGLKWNLSVIKYFI